MALEVPRDVPGTPFTRAGMMTLDGDVFEGKRKVGTDAILREIDYVQRNVPAENFQTRGEWEQVRNVFLLWCFSERTDKDNSALNSFFQHIGLRYLHVPDDTPPKVLDAIEARHDELPVQPTSPADWIKQRPPPQRLPTTPSLSPLGHGQQQNHFSILTSHTNGDVTHGANSLDAPRTPPSLNVSSPFHCRYSFTEHRQEYRGYQFQCIFRCLKDGKHCRKAPVREMNRHLRDRHHFRQGFKIVGVDWEKKRWRGAGADHDDCVGKLVEKDSADGTDEEDSEPEYVVQ